MSETTISPEAWRTILVRAPQLRHVSIDQHAFDPAIVADLNRTGWPRPGTIVTEHERDYAVLQINILNSRGAAEETFEPCIADLTIPYHLEFHAVSQSALAPVAAPLELSGYQAQWLRCQYAGDLRVTNFPALKHLVFYRCQKVEVSDVPLVEKLFVNEVGHLKLQSLPNLHEVTNLKCDEFEVHDCPKIEFLSLEKNAHAKLTNLPNLDDFFFQGDSFEFHNVPKLDSVVLQDPTLRQLRDLRQLPRLKYLHLEFNKPRTRLPTTGLAELQELPALERLCITGVIAQTADEQLAFLRSLHKLQRLKLLWINNHYQLPMWLAQNSAEKMKILPPQLEVLLTETPFANEEQRAAVLREYPGLNYVISTEKFKEKLGLRQRILRDLPSKSELAPYSERLDQESPASDPKE